MRRRTATPAVLLFFSGACALTYQTVWFRQFRLIFGASTFALGAVTGTLISTFFALEVFGNRKTLLVAVLVNVIIAVIARSVGARPSPAAAQHPLPAGEGRRPGEGRDRHAVLVAAAIVGFAFLLMELVWYRMLAPLLGGSTFTFGLILAVALLGIGLGGAAYSFWVGGGRATAGGFALTCSLEAAAIALPFALGDRLAVAEAFLRDLGQFGFHGYVLAWTLLTIVVVLPAAFIAGIQFPLLISLLGSGRDDVGRDVGHAYAWNTAGAIAGSLAGGFGLIPLLSAPGSWRLVIVLLALLGIAAAVAGRAFIAGIVAVAAISGTFALGPTAAWRHSGVGGGRSEIPKTANGLIGWIANARRTLVWDEDGRESSVALIEPDDYA